MSRLGQLDSQTAVAVLETLLTAAAESGAAIVISTHDLRIADRLGIRWSMRTGCLMTTQQAVLASR